MGHVTEGTNAPWCSIEHQRALERLQLQTSTPGTHSFESSRGSLSDLLIKQRAASKLSQTPDKTLHVCEKISSFSFTISYGDISHSLLQKDRFHLPSGHLKKSPRIGF